MNGEVGVKGLLEGDKPLRFWAQKHQLFGCEGRTGIVDWDYIHGASHGWIPLAEGTPNLGTGLEDAAMDVRGDEGLLDGARVWNDNGEVLVSKGVV